MRLSKYKIAARVVHPMFGHGVVLDRLGGTLEIYFVDVGVKKVLDSFVQPA